MCRLQNIAMGDFQESVTIGQTGRMDRQTPDKGIPMCCYASQATQKDLVKKYMLALECILYLGKVLD